MHARITEEMAGDDDRKHTSGGVFVAVDSNLGAVVGAEEGATDSISGNEGRIAGAWVERQRRFAGLLSVLLALRRPDSEELSPTGSISQASKTSASLEKRVMQPQTDEQRRKRACALTVGGSISKAMKGLVGGAAETSMDPQLPQSSQLVPPGDPLDDSPLPNSPIRDIVLTERDEQLLAELRRAFAMALPRCIVSRKANSWAEGLKEPSAVTSHGLCCAVIVAACFWPRSPKALTETRN